MSGVKHTPVKRKPWNAGTSKGWVDARGYRWLYVTENGRRVARREHRVLMERHLGRKLEPWEVVHHKDENPANNDLSNLEVVEFGAHTGEHSKGRRKNADARRSMEAFALMREELKRERSVKSDLMEAAKPFATAIMHLSNDAPDETMIDLRMGGNYVFYQVTLGDFRRALHAIARARGEQDGGGE